MKIIFLLLLLVLIPVLIDAYGTHQSLEKSCSVSIDGKLFPVSYKGQFRNNPDGSLYPGDASYFIFKFKGSDTCQGFKAEPIKSNGAISVLSHYVVMGPSESHFEKNIHPHNDLELVPKYLTVKHYYVDKISYSNCGNGRCSEIIPSETPSFSIREDQTIPSKLKKLLDGQRTASTYSIRIDETKEWGFASAGLNHAHSHEEHIFEDSDSVISFESFVQDSCSNLLKHQGCVFGHVEIDTEIVKTKCLFEELEKLSVTHELDVDVCVDVRDEISLTVQGKKIQCNDDKCKSIKVSKTSNLISSIASPDFDLILEKPPLKDRDYYDAKNLNGTFYLHDPVTITHDPTLPWKESRDKTIQFETTKTNPIILEDDFDCNENNCNYVISLNILHPTSHDFVNGQGMSIFNTTSMHGIGSYDFDYSTTAFNLGREISTATASTDAEIVSYDPQYVCYPYPLLKDVQEYTFDDRQAVVCQYLGNFRDGIIHVDERSKLNEFYNIGIMYDIPDPYYIVQNFTFSDGINISHDYLALESFNQTAMFSQKGYGKLYFDWPINHVVSPYGFNLYNNVTSYTTIISKDFAAKDTILNHYELRYPETAFTKDIVIKSINQNGTIINDKIEFDIIPYKDKSEYLDVYLYNKVLHDTENKIFAETVSGDTNPTHNTVTGFGMINTTIAKTMVPFENYDIYVGNGTKKWDGTLIDNIVYDKQGDDLSYRSPSDVVLSHLTPHTFRITLNDSITREFDMRYYEFGGKDNITINIQKDNELSAKRKIGFTTIQKPQNFGYIESLFVNDTPIKQDCSTGCVLYLLPPGELQIVAKNVWGGEAHTTLPKEPEPVIIQPKEPDYSLFITCGFFALIGYMIYYRFIKGKI